ncbi:hypothetical protein RN001_001362 [Aquatica leii]|uniref:Uncharacterized protein n=1 Tax=Aquatica leii TaxID=1421715 RepID=A0AAN7SCP5_9COLE|nr:hypothetical protein RN001_001362 [Aquatica leii]
MKTSSTEILTSRSTSNDPAQMDMKSNKNFMKPVVIGWDKSKSYFLIGLIKDSNDNMTQVTKTKISKLSNSELLHELEIRLNQEIVNSFRVVASASQLEEKYVALYDFWKSLDPQNVTHDTTLENNLPSNDTSQTICDIPFNEHFWFNSTLEATVDADGVVILVPSCPEKPISPIPTPSSVPNNVCEETRDNFSDNTNRLTREYQIKEKEIRTSSNSPPKNGFLSPSFPKNMTLLLPHSLTTPDTVCENIEIQISESRNPIICQDEITQNSL